MDDALIARRQKDLDNYTEKIQAELEKMARIKMAGMKTYWQALDYKLRQKTKKLYEELGAMQDPRKIKALQGKIERLEAYIQQIQIDIKTHEAGAQPFFTTSLKHQFEAGYYLNAFGLEQAARVAVNVPVLTPAQVLGVLVNPWLPDGLNYSDRIRLDTSALAQAMKKHIENAVNEGLDWNTTARNIQQATGESYFRAVRLAKTELNRAASLGASYCYMQNEDVLDGKRWNATLDSKTAPKDAANDGEVFDVDYDTPENPGVPGKRIPNHPHCRCVWSPVLSALGINNRERIARDKDGARTWTKAGTYREYAKEKGLPDLDKRLKADNPNKYLRKGETVASLQKQVKRWTYQGKSITVSKPDWISLTETATIEPVNPMFEQLKATVDKYYKNGKISSTGRKGLARELLDAVGLKHVPEYLENTRLRGYCQYDSKTEMSGVLGVTKYVLQSTDNRKDVYKVKTAFHELFHAAGDKLSHDFGIGWSFDNWCDIEEVFAETASHYLIKAVGIEAKLQPAYTEKLARNLPRLKQLDMFKDCSTIEDFGKIVVQYRMIDYKPSYWRSIAEDCAKVKFDKVGYAQQYAGYIIDNIDDLLDKHLENSPGDVQYRDLIKQDAVKLWSSIKQGNGIPVMKQAEYVYNNILVAAMRELGVK